MNEPSVGQSSTVLGHLVERLRARDVALDGQDRPVAILWTDPKAEWKPLVELMLTQVPELLVFGDYSPEHRRGPAIWLRCIVDGCLDEASMTGLMAPILYLPGVARQDLRAGEQCREELRPLVELMYRGAMWLQHNGKDWGVSTFLSSNRALGLDIAGDRRTAQALLRALPELAMASVDQLSGRRLESEDFDRMLSDDVNRDVLRWMGDPQGARARLGGNRWDAFCSRSRDVLDFDPSEEADVIAGAKLGYHLGPWANVWSRFKEAPASFPGIASLLSRSRPIEKIPYDREPWPDLNQKDEATVRRELGALLDLPHGEACEAILTLENQHGTRRYWPWASLAESPMAEVLGPLSILAKAVRSAIGGDSADAIASAYEESGWRADAAAWRAVAITNGMDEALVGKVVRHLLQPWLEDSARAFQKALERTFLPARGEQELVTASEGGCLFFVDGLRFDLGQILVEQLEGRGCRVSVKSRWAGAPTVTATAKPAVMPIAESITGKRLQKNFCPRFDIDGRMANAHNLRKAMGDIEYQVLETGAMQFPPEQSARGWMEFGSIDKYGHKLEGQLARRLGDEVSRITECVVKLLDDGWVSVRVVTDHGWLLLPGGLPRVDLPKYLTESRWARCAVITGGSTPDVPRFPWHWNSEESFATAPGISCFNKSVEYAHGGLSIQECLLPDILVERVGGTEVRAGIQSITWRKMRCFIEANAEGSVVADLRLGQPAGKTVVTAVKMVEEGAVSLLLQGDEHEEARLVLVLLDEAGTVLAHRSTRVGEDS